MAGNRTLKLSILADVDNLRKNLNTADTEVSGFGSKLDGFASKAGLAFAAAGAAVVAYAGKLAVDGVKAAIDDEAAQLKLATTLKNVTGATNDQISATEKAITKMQLQYGVSDEQLRPSLDRLVRSTKDVTEAQKLQELALNISAGTGKDLTAVSEALAKAHDGNFGALKRLGVSLDESIIKTKDFDGATAELAKTFKDQASTQAGTFSGKMDRLKMAFGEAKETIGGVILDALTPMITILVDKVIPAVSDFIDSIGGTKGIKQNLQEFIEAIVKFAKPVFEGLKSAFDSIKKAVDDNKESFMAVWEFLKTYLLPFFGGAFKVALQVLGKSLAVIVDLIGSIISGFRTIISIGDQVGGFFSGLFGGGKASGGSVMGGTTYLVGERGPELFTPSSSGTIIPNDKLYGGGTTNTVNITVNGAIDPISTARQIADILGYAATSAGTFTNLGVSRVVV